MSEKDTLRWKLTPLQREYLTMKEREANRFLKDAIQKIIDDIGIDGDREVRVSKDGQFIEKV